MQINGLLKLTKTPISRTVERNTLTIIERKKFAASMRKSESYKL